MTPMMRKNLRLVNIPVTWFFPLLVLLLIVPGYPYVMVFLYQVLGLYFVFQGVRENHDVHFSLLLPVRKRDIARSYMEAGLDGGARPGGGLRAAGGGALPDLAGAQPGGDGGKYRAAGRGAGGVRRVQPGLLPHAPQDGFAPGRAGGTGPPWPPR